MEVQRRKSEEPEGTSRVPEETLINLGEPSKTRRNLGSLEKLEGISKKKILK